jgi:hypothetical protein
VTVSVGRFATVASVRAKKRRMVVVVDSFPIMTQPLLPAVPFTQAWTSATIPEPCQV